MFRYLNRNLISLFTKQRLLSLLLVLNIVVSCLVICFSYGLYQNYNVILLKGEEKDYKYLKVLINEEGHIAFDEKNDAKFVADITPSMLMDMLMALSDETKNSLKGVEGVFITDSPLSKGDPGKAEEWENDGTISAGDEEIEYYSDDTEPYYIYITFYSAIKEGKFVDAFENYEYFTDEQYSEGEKVAAVDEGLYGHSAFSYLLSYSGLAWSLRTLPEGTDSIIIGGERYEIVKVVPSNDMSAGCEVLVPLTAMPENAKILIGIPEPDETKSCFTFEFNKPVTREQYADIQDHLSLLGDKVFLEDMKLTEATEIYYYKTIMLISVVIAVLAAINMAILYRYILEKRSPELAIFRICGCSKIQAINSYLIECLIINVPLFALTQLIYHKLIMPRLAGFFPHIEGAYSFKLYAAIFGIYVITSFFVMMLMINSTVNKHSLVDLRNSTKATSKFGIMKIFEIIQLAIVLAMMVLIVSAIISRYSLFSSFEQYIERRGYLVQSTDGATYPEDFEELIENTEYIMNQSGSIIIGDFDSGDYTSFGGIIYSDEFVAAYKPMMEDGVWLSDIDETYESSGYIPTVVTSCDGRYKVGDVLEQDYYLDYVDGEPTRTVHAKYKIVGILADKVRVASYDIGGSVALLPNKNYEDIYNVFSDSFEEEDYLLRRISDEYACIGSYNPVFGIQFVFCDDMTDEEYEELGRKLNNTDSFAAVPLYEVYDNSLDHIYEQMYTLFPIAVCIFILTIISTVSISAIYTKRQLRNYAIFYICGARWRTCALKSLKNGAITCTVSAVLSALILIVGKSTLLKETVISFGIWHIAVCAGVIVLYLMLSMIMPLSIIGSAEPREVLKEE